MIIHKDGVFCGNGRRTVLMGKVLIIVNKIRGDCSNELPTL